VQRQRLPAHQNSRPTPNSFSFMDHESQQRDDHTVGVERCIRQAGLQAPSFTARVAARSRKATTCAWHTEGNPSSKSSMLSPPAGGRSAFGSAREYPQMRALRPLSRSRKKQRTRSYHIVIRAGDPWSSRRPTLRFRGRSLRSPARRKCTMQ
jgi:hypothetical protein